MKSAASLGAVREFFPNLRIAVVSGSKRRQDILLALEAGVHGYVPKSMGPLELVNALKLINAGVIYIPPSLACLPTASEEEQEQSKADPEKRALAEALTPRQKDVLELLIQGRSNKAIAQTLNLGEGTVKVHMAALFRAFGVNSRSAVAVAGAQVLSSRG
jgi:DNA-binding NarL/FixJ family response regulator